MSLSSYQTSYQISPIILVGGAAGTGMLPIVSLLNSQNYDLGILSASGPETLESLFGQFRPLSGHTLMDNEIATYPFANQTVAANAVITNPLRVSLEMLAPANGNITVANKLSVITSLKSTLDQHTALGGWYNVATPSFIYTGCLLKDLVDATDEEDGAQVQVRWVWSFIQPLITLAAAQAAQNQAMNRISNQCFNTGDPPGSNPVVTGVTQPSSNIVQNLVPAASSPQGSNVAPFTTASLTSSLQYVSPVSPGT